MKALKLLVLILCSNVCKGQSDSDLWSIKYQVIYQDATYSAYLRFFPEIVEYVEIYDGVSSREMKNRTNTIMDTSATMTIFYDKERDSIFTVARHKTDIVKDVLVAEKREKIVWKLTDSTRLVGEHTCKLAKCNFRGRKYLVWYTPALNSSSIGPWKLHGLPGMIVLAEESEGFISFIMKSIVPNSVDSNNQPPTIPDLPIISREIYRKALEDSWRKIGQNVTLPPGFTVEMSYNFDYLERK